MTSTQLPSQVFPQAPTVQVKIDRRTDDGNLGEGGEGSSSMFVLGNQNNSQGSDGITHRSSPCHYKYAKKCYSFCLMVEASDHGYLYCYNCYITRYARA
jgi:hypothetical protein